MPRRKPPSRLRYEAEHPSLTVRVPAEVKVSVLTAAAAEGLSVSEWVQAMATGHARDAAKAYERGLAEGRIQGRKAQAIIDAAVLWSRYGDQLGSTDDCWFDRQAVRWASSLTSAELECLRGILADKPNLAASVRRWLKDSNLPALPV